MLGLFTDDVIELSVNSKLQNAKTSVTMCKHDVQTDSRSTRCTQGLSILVARQLLESYSFISTKMKLRRTKSKQHQTGQRARAQGVRTVGLGATLSHLSPRNETLALGQALALAALKPGTWIKERTKWRVRASISVRPLFRVSQTRD